ncbi:MAG TPA: hypothetical protein VEB40_15580 [Flavipsychrobacter sp.]|nr:hypothetical protein [Flavipsychrobacter sp.]
MEKPKHQPLLETTLTWLEKLLTIGQIAVASYALFYYASKFTKAEWGGPLFLCLFFMGWIIQAIRVAKTFQLFADRLVVRRPFSITTKTDRIFKVAELREVIFRNVKGRFGGPHLIIKAKKFDDSFRIVLGEKRKNDFIDQLTKLGVKVSRENM